MDKAGRIQFAADADGELSRALAVVLAQALSGMAPEEVLEVGHSQLAAGQALGCKCSLSCKSVFLCWLYAVSCGLVRISGGGSLGFLELANS